MFDDMGSSLNRVPFGVPKIVRHPYKKDPHYRDPKLECYPSDITIVEAMTLEHHHLHAPKAKVIRGSWH